MSSHAPSRASSMGGASSCAGEVTQREPLAANSTTPSIVSSVTGSMDGQRAGGASTHYKATHTESPASVTMTPPLRASPTPSAHGGASSTAGISQPQRFSGFSSIPRVPLDTDASPGNSRSQPFAGTLFPSFDHEANYLAKQAELRSLGGFYNSVDEEEGDAIGHRSTSSSHPQPLRGREEAASREAEEDMKTLERQIKRRDELYIAAQRRADEAKEYSSMIAHLRAEAKRSEQMHSDVHSSLVAQVESLQYVVQRRNDADNQTAKIRFVDVEDEVLTVSKELGDDLVERQRLVERLGEQSIEYVEQLAKQATGVVYELAHQEVLEKELRETEELLLQQVTIKVSMVTDRIRSELCKALSSEMRAAYLVTPGGGTSAAIRRVLSSFAARDVAHIAASIRNELQDELVGRATAAYTEAHDDLPRLIEHSFQTVEAEAARVLEDALTRKSEALDAEVRKINQHLEETRSASEQRRRHEEAALRHVILDMGKLLESQRLAMNDLRTQLLLQARAQSIAMSPRSGKGRGGAHDNGTSSAKRTKSRSPGIGNSSAAQRRRPSSPSTSKRLLFEPLSEQQIKSLYGSLPTQATVVEEVSVERLSRLTAKATHAKKSTQHEQDQLILVSRAPASLLGRGSNSKVHTKLTSVGLQNKQGASVTSVPSSDGAASGQQPGGGTKGGKPGYSSGELATLQELRRLRVKIGSTPS